MELLTERYADKITGTLGCYDRVVITGTLPVLSNSHQMTGYLYLHEVRIFDYAKFAEPFRDKLKENAEKIAAEEGVAIEYIRKSKVRKEAVVEKVLQKRGNHPGLVHIISVLEACNSYKTWHDKSTGKNYLKPDQGKCLTYYFYFIDKVLGLCYVRVPTWLPFKLQIYFNGHQWLSNELKRRKIEYKMADNAFVEISHWEKAQQISDDLPVNQLHKILDQFAKTYCPVHQSFNQCYHWSIMQCEYSRDLVFKSKQDLNPIYEGLIESAIHTVKPDNIATFLSKKIHGKYEGEIGMQYQVRTEGSRVKHTMGSVSIKMYDKFDIYYGLKQQ